MRLIAIAFVLSTQAVPIFAQDRCAAILAAGIFDEEHSLSLEAEHRLVRRAACRSQDNAVVSNYFSYLGKSRYCSKSYQEVLRSKLLINDVKRASAEIVNAWTECVTQSRGLLHYFTTTSDPELFTYRLLFDDFQGRGGIREAIILDWSMEPASVQRNCTGKTPQKGDPITSSGIEITCRRQRNDVVLVRIASTLDRVDAIELPAHQDDYILTILGSDDFAACSVGKDKGREVRVASRPIRGGRPRVVLTERIDVDDPDSYLFCWAEERTRNANREPCWSYDISLEKNGEEVLRWEDNCCRRGCARGPRVWEERVYFVDLNKGAKRTR